MTVAKILFTLACLIGETAGVAHGIELDAATVSAWQGYLGRADAQMQTRLDAEQPFLWIDESPDRAARVRRGEILVSPLVGQGTQDVPQGLIHDWIGAAFIPNATIETLRTVVHDYDHYKQMYKPRRDRFEGARL